MANRGFDIIDKIHNSIQAVLFESYYSGIDNSNLGYKKISAVDRAWLDTKIKQVKSYNLDVISLDYVPLEEVDKSDELVHALQKKGLIPYVSDSQLNAYGRSSKNAIKREILTLIDESTQDRSLQDAHKYGALPLEYLGYIQKLYNIKNGLPTLRNMRQYAGVIVWLPNEYNDSKELIAWASSLKTIGIKVVFVNNFGTDLNKNSLDPLGIKLDEMDHSLGKNSIVAQDKMMNYETKVSKNIPIYLTPKDAHPLLSLKDNHGNISTLAAITPWGGYAVGDAFMTTIGSNHLWCLNPFTFFQKALGLESLIVPDATTENGKRILFAHLDCDGIAQPNESDPQTLAGDEIYNTILEPYKIPQSVYMVGAEIDSSGINAQESQKLTQLAQKIYALDYVEGGAHIFSNPTFDSRFAFSPQKDISDAIKTINHALMPKDKAIEQKAKTISWSTNLTPLFDMLEYVYAHDLLNINGGDTLIDNQSPWLSLISPMGLERQNYYQIYSGEQSDYAYTNSWNEPFWGYRKVIQTFEKTESPRRLKPIDIYYHFYSGSKDASLKALKDVFAWATKQETIPLFTSEYIKKSMDFYTVSMAQEGDSWLYAGMQNIHTVRAEKENYFVDFNHSTGIVGSRYINNRTYFNFDPQSIAILSVTQKKQDLPYLIDANAPLVAHKGQNKNQTYVFKGYVDLSVDLNIPKGCSVSSTPKEVNQSFQGTKDHLNYKDIKEATIDVLCR